MFSSNTSRVSADANYIEDVFSTWLYTGNGSTQTITNGIDLSTKGGMVWIKGRSGATAHCLYDTQRGVQQELNTNFSDGQVNATQGLTSFTSTGFSLGTRNSVNSSTATYASWTFRKQAKFFDVVTYTGNGSSDRSIPHSLGTSPAVYIVKRTDSTGDWYVYYGFGSYLKLNTSDAAVSSPGFWGSTPSAVTTFGVGNAAVNTNGATYVAYLFASNAGGFGLTGSDNVISCGSFTSNASGNASISLGYEPQWILYKPSSSVGNWEIADVMRGWNNTNIVRLYPDSSAVEGGYTAQTPNTPTATGVTFTGVLNASSNYIYIAIRRGPMKVPTSGTSVYYGLTRAGTGASATVTGVGFPPDAVISSPTTGAWGNSIFDKLRGPNNIIRTNTTAAENSSGTFTNQLTAFGQEDYSLGNDGNYATINFGSGTQYVNWALRRAPGFFDVVCYTGTGSNTTQAHNLGVVPELMIVKRRSSADSWIVYAAPLGATKYLQLETTSAAGTLSTLFNGAPTASIFNLGTRFETNGNASTYVNYLFATCPGVSKVGSYTGSGTTKQIDCGFTNGARFVLIKRTDSTGDWYVWDTARGIVSGNDPYLLLNSTAAEVTNTDYIDTYSAGFELSSTAPAALNANLGSYIFLAIA